MKKILIVEEKREMMPNSLPRGIADDFAKLIKQLNYTLAQVSFYPEHPVVIGENETDMPEKSDTIQSEKREENHV